MQEPDNEQEISSSVGTILGSPQETEVCLVWAEEVLDQPRLEGLGVEGVPDHSPYQMTYCGHWTLYSMDSLIFKKPWVGPKPLYQML